MKRLITTRDSASLCASAPNKLLPPRNIITWTHLIGEHVRCRQGTEALKLYKRMQEEGTTPNNFTFVAALKACSIVQDIETGKQIHDDVIRTGYYNNIFVASSLVDMYAKCGSMENALHVFEKIRQKDVVLWNSMIMGYAQMDMANSALQLYDSMQYEGFLPNASTFVAVLKACSSFKEGDGGFLSTNYLVKGRTIHGELIRGGFETDVFVANTLVDMYAECGSMEEARLVFNKMRHRDVVSWNAIIMGYARMDMGKSALELYACMQRDGFTPNARTFVAALKACASLATKEEGKITESKSIFYVQGKAIHCELAKRGLESDIFVASTLVDMYAKCGRIEDARQVFEKMTCRNVVSWNAMIIGYAQMGMGDAALELYESMQREGFTPDAHTFVALLKACGSLPSLEAGKEIHSHILRIGLDNQSFVASCLIHMYGKCGSMDDAQCFFDSLVAKDSITWNALIAGYSGQGDSERSLHLYKRMQQEGVMPDGITFIFVLTVCSHNGLVQEGQMYFQTMRLVYGISPYSDHYMCMADLLGRAGHLDEAFTMMQEMQFKPNMDTWMTILGACRKWNNIETGRHVFECAVMLEKAFAGAYALMINIYVSAGMLEESATIQEMRTKSLSLDETRRLRHGDGDRSVFLQDKNGRVCVWY